MHAEISVDQDERDRSGKGSRKRKRNRSLHLAGRSGRALWRAPRRCARAAKDSPSFRERCRPIPREAPAAHRVFAPPGAKRPRARGARARWPGRAPCGPPRSGARDGRTRRDTGFGLDEVDDIEPKAAREIGPGIVIGDELYACERRQSIAPPLTRQLELSEEAFAIGDDALPCSGPNARAPRQCPR